MKKIVLKKYNALIGIVLTILGFSSACEQGADEYGSPVEYGAPYGDFEVNGYVTDENNAVLKNIQISMGYDTVYSDNEGNYTVSEQNHLAESNTFILRFRDIDGIENGEYSDLDTSLTFDNSELTGGDGWYQGKAQKTIDVKLKPKQ